MNTKERREKYEESLRRKQEEDFKRRNDSGRFKSIFKDDVQKELFWKCGEGPHIIDIIPYFAGEGNPHAKEGDYVASLDIYRHAKIGPNENSYICLSRTFGDPCPVCELQTEMRALGTYDDAEVKALNASRRLIYNIHVLDNEVEKKKGIRIWEVSQFLFGQELDDLADNVGRKVHYASHKVGRSISFKRKGSGPTNTKFSAFEFVERKQVPSDAILDAALTLEDLMYFPKYDEIVAALPRNEITERLFAGKTTKLGTEDKKTEEDVRKELEILRRASVELMKRTPIKP